MFGKLYDFLVLPQICSEFEDKYLSRMNRVAEVFFLAHLPIFVLIAYLNDTGPGTAFVLTALTLAGPLLAMRSFESKRAISIVMGITAMFMGGLLVHFGQGPVQIEMHFYFFVLLALLAVFANPMVILAAAVTVSLHHAVLWLFLPASVFNYDAPFWVVAVHAAFVVLESAAACFIARSFFDNVIELEKKVSERTIALASRNQDMRMLLDSVEQGFFCVDRLGVISEERSAAVDRLLSEPAQGMTFAELLAEHDSKAADLFDIGLEEVFDGFMPIELTLDQLPSRCRANERTLSIAYNPIHTDDQLTGLAVVVSDISAEVQREELEHQNREMMEMTSRIASDKTGFLEFLRESDGIIDGLKRECRDDLITIKRSVHTLKGNASIFGLNRISLVCQEIEDLIAEEQSVPDDVAWTRLFGCWASTRGNVRRLLGDERVRIMLDDDEYFAVLQDILKKNNNDKLACRVASWRLEPTQNRLERVAKQAKQLSKSLGKGDIDIELVGGHLRTDPNHWSGFWSAFVHVVRNAVDHGLESPEDRRLKDKSEFGTLTVKTELKDDEYAISIVDDGSGIDWDRIREIAQDQELPSSTHDELVDLLFRDGITTKRVASQYSGRGVGMAAIKQACAELGGRVEVSSETDGGSEFRFVFPASAMAPETFEMLSDYGIENVGFAVGDAAGVTETRTNKTTQEA